ncbi:DNA-directed RNA polymerase subunit N [Candidatus Micrarchaeota archaeon]|nr:DNA-directed RNA polymerase subunit N [Candidatus Micrarchaeota archaeon]MBI5177381.1 DNA-directed RNA polymerase subunit N [Candidatus Micrarchaeota archaeon]
MIVPIRCFSCGKPIGDKYDEFRESTEAGRPVADVLTSLGMDRYCCRRMFVAQVDLTDEIKKYPRF